MAKKIQLRLISSSRMTEAGERNVIRFPRQVRDHLGFHDSCVVVGKGEYETSLRVKKAYREDVRKLASMIRNGRVPEEEARKVGFVAKPVRERVTRKRGGDTWISTGLKSITVGADPEFGLIRGDGLLMRGDKVLPKQGKFGSDGPGVEVRPDPSRNHCRVVENMQEILLNPPAAAKEYKWLGGATYRDPRRFFWFGGHIHLGRPEHIEAEFSHLCYSRIARALDNMLALPIVRFDIPYAHKRRNGCPQRYGVAGSIRDDYPEGNRFEYRVLSGLWFVHPTLAKIAIGVAKCITETAYNHIADSKFDYDWVDQPPSRKGLLRSLGLTNIRKTEGIINRADPGLVDGDTLEEVSNQLRNLDQYEEYSEEIEALLCLSEEPESFLKGKVCLDVQKNWSEEETPLPEASRSLQERLEAVQAKD